MGKDNLKYIGSRMVSSKSRIAFREGARRAMRMNGYVIIAENGWVVKKYKDGQIERIQEIVSVSNQELKLD